MINKKILITLTFIFSLITRSSALELTITNDLADILGSKKICLRLTLGSSDQAIFCNSLSFSIDSPAVTITSWDSNQNPSLQYVTSFKRVKKLYTKSIDCELLLNFDTDNKKTILKNLSSSGLYVSCIVLDQNGTSRPINLFKPIDDGFSLVDTMTLNNALTFDLTTTHTTDGLKNKSSSIKPFVQPQKPEPATENILIDNLRDIWGRLVGHIKSFLTHLHSLMLYLIFFILMILLLIRRFRASTGPWETEFRRFLGMLCILWAYSFLGAQISSHIFFIIFAGLITPISFYYIFTARTESTLDKLKSFIGFALAMSILPILIKAFLSFMF